MQLYKERTDTIIRIDGYTTMLQGDFNAFILVFDKADFKKLVKIQNI